MWSILLVEDSPDIPPLVRNALGNEFQVRHVESLGRAREVLDNAEFDLVLLDLVLPDGPGFELCAALQSDDATRETPIIFLSGRSDTASKVTALSLGAEDYVEKPFDRQELRARALARLRKREANEAQSSVLRRGNLRLDLARQRAVVTEESDERELGLTPHEFRLLHFLATRIEHVLSREQLRSAVWGEVVIADRTIDSHVSNLRKKMGLLGGCIQSVRGAGYRFSAASS